MAVAISVRTSENSYTCALSYLSTEPFPYLTKSPRQPDLLTHHFYFWLLVTSSVECRLLSEPQCLTTQALPPLPTIPCSAVIRISLQVLFSMEVPPTPQFHGTHDLVHSVW